MELYLKRDDKLAADAQFKNACQACGPSDLILSLFECHTREKDGVCHKIRPAVLLMNLVRT